MKTNLSFIMPVFLQIFASVMLDRANNAMVSVLQDAGNQLLIQRSQMASEQIDAFIYVSKGFIHKNAYMISESLDNRLLGEDDYPLTLGPILQPIKYDQLDKDTMTLIYGDELVSYERMTYNDLQE